MNYKQKKDNVIKTLSFIFHFNMLKLVTLFALIFFNNLLQV